MSNTTSSSELIQALSDLHQRYQAAYADVDRQPTTEYIDEWQAPCYASEVRYGEVAWRPVLQQPKADFSGVEHGLEMPLNAQVKAFYGQFFAADLYVTVDTHPVVLSQVMCSEDLDRLQRNLIAHVLMKRRLGQPETLFIGTGEESEDLIISVDNATGVVGLEYAGKPQHAELAPNLTAFLHQCQARVVAD
ncbi:SecY-interacting protein [Aliidiomarina maris]|uniref:SecY interacting protein Syd n=1 Tax=Aliidiomarina maris TaxID=531312 RepID=A0A327WX96_9GAMM|nr:SecY-interacting protein [Aliidiomarina maris]RAJ96540.1 SecY interacting protein Syd [Aliidiomarina maris]RUO23714.1 SecY-interacting protein [Aliidiomarina maris]